ncbi:MAG: metallophosphoesterase [Clostridium sp.]|nr:metallophosphoesterase [Clostridium sp.]
MKIGVVSDTHIPSRAKALPAALMEGLRGVDLIIHAGDLLKDYVLYELEEIAPVEAVAGNNDDEYIRSKLPDKKIIKAGKFRIGIIHGYGRGSNTLYAALAAFSRDNVDCVVFGHSHVPFNETVNGILCVNPGSPTDKRWQEHYSYGIITVGDSNISAEIKYF